MMGMRRLMLGLVCILMVFSLVSCSDGDISSHVSSGADSGNDISLSENDDDDYIPPVNHELVGARVRVGVLRGPSGMGLAPLMQWAEGEQRTVNSYHFTQGGAPEDMTAGLISGSLDIAQLPVNLASVLYHRLDGDIRVIAINILGVLSILDRTGEISGIEDLRGRTIHITGQGAMPQFVFEHLLRQHNMQPGVDVTIVYNAEHSELAALLVAGNVDIGLLPQPFVATVLQRSDDVRIAIDLSEAWEEANPGLQLVQGVVVVRVPFLEQHPNAVTLFLRDHFESVSYVNLNADRAAVLMEQYDILPAEIAAAAIPHSNLVHIEGAEMRPLIESILEVLYEANPQAVGGALPDEDFFFLG